MSLCIGLFGTCGNTTWRRTLFIPEYNNRGFCYFNPQVDDWIPELAEIEAEHLANDQIILFPITNETYGLGSLGEVGFSILNAIKLDDRRDFLIMIHPLIDTKLDFDWDDNLIKESIKMRALVKQHLIKLNYSNVFLIETLEEMLETSIVLYENRLRLKPYMTKFSLGK